MPLATDPGLWVQGDGRLLVRGSARFPSWARAAGSLAGGETTITLDSPPAGWRPGDEVAVAPSLPPTVAGYAEAYDHALIVSVFGKVVTLDRPLALPHPAVSVFGRLIGPEVLNLTRNVRFEGTSTGRAHLMFNRTTQKQRLRYFAILRFAPQKGDGFGRYGLHFHKAVDGSRGSLIEGAVVRDVRNWGVVVHRSHGVTVRESILHDGFGQGFTWDSNCPGGPDVPCANQASHDTLWERDVVSRMTGPGNVKGFNLEAGLRNVLRDAAAFGVLGDLKNSGGVEWPANAAGGKFDADCDPAICAIWDARRLVVHNNSVGFRNWQNTSRFHVVGSGSVLYRNGKGLLHGAYSNPYEYRDMDFYGNAVNVDVAATASTAGPARFRNFRVDCAGIADFAVVDDRRLVVSAVTPMRFEGLLAQNCRVAAFGVVTPNAGNSQSGLPQATFWEVEGLSTAGLDVRFGSAVHPLTFLRLALPGGGKVEYRRADTCPNPDPARNACVILLAPTPAGGKP